MTRILSVFVFFTSILLPLSSLAGEVSVINTDIKALGGQKYRFNVTLQHQDAGWDHYADRWEILSPQGTILATRTLYHPHVNEQPFTRTLSTTLPAGISSVTIRGHDSVHGYGDNVLILSLPVSR